MSARGKMDIEFITWLERDRDRLREELVKAQSAYDQAEKTLARAKGGAPVENEVSAAPPAAQRRSQRGSVKSEVIRLVTEHAAGGLVASELVDLGKAQGLDLNRGSVSSLLSKLAAEGTLVFRDGKYRPAQPVPPKQPPSGAGHAPLGGPIHAPLRA